MLCLFKKQGAGMSWHGSVDRQAEWTHGLQEVPLSPRAAVSKTLCPPVRLEQQCLRHYVPLSD